MSRVGCVILALCLSLALAEELEWWEGGNFYQIYPRSFKDKNGDGVGDLLGIASEIAYLKNLGMDGVWLSPIMKSPQADFGYDISDYRDIHWEYGSLADFDVLLAECKKYDVKLILDLVPNHSSNEHEWFIKSEKRKQFYLHAFLYQQPDLNYRNRRVVQEIKDVITFWLSKGVQGFRIDAVPFMFEVRPDARGNYPDEPVTGESCPNPDDYCSTQHIYTQDQPETFDMIYQWRELMDEYARSHDKITKVIMTEAYTSLENMIRFYGDGKRNGSHIPFNFELISNVNSESTAADYKLRIDNWLTRVPKGKYANWVLGNHDQHRLATRLGVERTDLLNILLQTLPGMAVTYQGEEMGLVNTHLTWAETVDPAACNTMDPVNYEKFSRDPCRTPFPWNTEKNAGFSTNDTTWLPVNPDYETNNVATQMAAANSHLKIFLKLTKLRKKSVLRQGEYEGKLTNDNNVLIYRRWFGDEDLVVVILNFGAEAATVNVKEAFDMITEDTLTVYTASLDTLSEGSSATLTEVVVPANKAVVLASDGVIASLA